MLRLSFAQAVESGSAASTVTPPDRQPKPKERMTAIAPVARSACRQRVPRMGAAFHNLAALPGAQAVIAATT
jgi:hypothetical protein